MGQKRIRIAVKNECNFSREKEPVTGGIPIPFEENLKNTENLMLYDANNNAVPCQFTPLAWWPGKEKIKWVLLHFQADAAAHDITCYYLELDAENTVTNISKPKDIKPIAYKENNMITVDNGVINTVIHENTKPNLFGIYPRLLTMDGIKLFPGNISAAKVDETGSERAVIKLAGPYVDQQNEKSSFTYSIRIEFYRNKSYFRLFNTIISLKNDAKLADASLIIAEANSLKDPSETAIYNQNGHQLLKGNFYFDNNIRLLQDSPYHVYLYENQNQKKMNEQFQGWVTSEKASASVRFFWQMYPKSLEADDSEIRIGLLPKISQVKDSFMPAQQITDCYKFGEGEARTHETMIILHNRSSKSSDMWRVFAGFNNPIIPTAPWEWYVNSKTLGDLTVRDYDNFPKFEQFVDDSLSMVLKRREKLCSYGDRNFGDDQMGTPGLWNNCEYDYPHVGILQFLRGADKKWYDCFTLPAARHMLNIDFVNAGKNVGMIYQHCAWHNSSAPKLGSHSWLQGILEYFLVSGDYQARDFAKLCGDKWSRSILNNSQIEGTERGVTWPIISMLALYQVFAEPLYMQAAEKLRNKMVKLFRHDLGHFEGCMKREKYPPAYWQVFLIGSPVLESLIMYDQMTYDEEVRQIIITIAKRLARINWIKELGVWEYTRTGTWKSDKKDHSPKTDRMVSPGVGYAYLYSGDLELWEKALTAFENRYGMLDNEGKTMTQSLRFGVRMPAIITKVNNKTTKKL